MRAREPHAGSVQATAGSLLRREAYVATRGLVLTVSTGSRPPPNHLHARPLIISQWHHWHAIPPASNDESRITPQGTPILLNDY